MNYNKGMYQNYSVEGMNEINNENMMSEGCGCNNRRVYGCNDRDVNDSKINKSPFIHHRNMNNASAISCTSKTKF